MPDPDRVQISPAKDLGIMGACVSKMYIHALIRFLSLSTFFSLEKCQEKFFLI